MSARPRRHVGELGLQGAILFEQRRHHAFDFRLGKSRRDVLRAVPVERFDGEHDGAFDAGVVIRSLEFGDELGVFASVDEACARPKF